MHAQLIVHQTHLARNVCNRFLPLLQAAFQAYQLTGALKVEKKIYITGYSQVVTHQSTNPAQHCLSDENWCFQRGMVVDIHLAIELSILTHSTPPRKLSTHCLSDENWCFQCGMVVDTHLAIELSIYQTVR